MGNGEKRQAGVWESFGERQRKEKYVGDLREKNGKWLGGGMGSRGRRGGESDCFGKMSKLNLSEKVAKDAGKWRGEKDDFRATSRWCERRERCGSLASV